MDHIAVKQWKVFQVNHWKDQRRILASLAAKLSIFDLPMIEQLTSTDDLELDQMKDQHSYRVTLLSINEHERLRSCKWLDRISKKGKSKKGKT